MKGDTVRQLADNALCSMNGRRGLDFIGAVPLLLSSSGSFE
jgi:hypothetical protein